MGCRCASGTVKIAATDHPDGSLGTFVPGGNTMGIFDTASNVTKDARFSSLAKFEPHFTIEIQKDPGVPAKCTKEEWQRLSMSLCSEGQEINYTHHEMAGGADTAKPYKRDGKEYPFDKRKGASFGQDGHGYKKPSESGSPQVLGTLKAYDPPNIIHWLDAPGLYNASSATWKPKLPTFDENYFHTYVHGTSGKPEDNCDCYHYVKDVALAADGSVAPVIEAASCSP